MNLRITVRIAALGVAAALMGLLIGIITQQSQWQANELRERLRQVDSESFRIADQFKDYMRELNFILLGLGITGDSTDLIKFPKASQELDAWINDQKPKLNSEKEREIMQQIDRAYDDYQLVAQEL